MSGPSERLWKGGTGRGSCSSNQDKSFETEDRDTETVVDMVSMLSCQDASNAQRILLALTGSAESCQALRKAGCIPLLIQILHPINVPLDDHPTAQTKLRAALTLKNVVQFNCDEKTKRKEMRVLKLLESLRSYVDYLKNRVGDVDALMSTEKHPIASSTALMKLSFDEDHRNAMCLLGAIHTLADLIQTDHKAHGINENPDCVTMRRYNGMTLTNLTVGDKRNKLLLGTMREFMIALVAQLDSPSEDVCQVMASVLRNLSWHASSALKASLVDSNAVRKLMLTAIKAKKESTLKAALSALWNLSAHSHANKIAICHTPDAIDVLVGLLESRTLTIVENAGGILTNISIVTTTDESTRERFRACGILEILLDHLQSSSILVVGNACGMLWHLSNCELNQEKLIQLGAVRKLKVLAGSKHERIKHGACSTLRNILSNRELSVQSPQVEPVRTNPEDLTTAVEQQQPMDLRKSVSVSSDLKPSDLQLRPSDLSNEPLDLSFHSSKSTPIHTVSATEFGSRAKGIPFLNPPLQSKNAFSYDSPKNYNSCPEFVRYIQPAHKSTPIDFSQEESAGGGATGDRGNARATEDATINYSLHFHEPPEDSVTIKCEDTVKTYYCEGTPLNFSTSNSMTDLTQVEKPVKLKPIIETETTDDLPRKYCTESTPATFSRASSLSSIASNLQGGENKAEYFEEPCPKLTNGNGCASSKDRAKRNVTFSAADTPLMFSRTSSVNSLDSVDVNYEDAGSVMSEFSRRMSEVVSPSELPDSPRQIAPPEPRHFDRPEMAERTNEETKHEGEGLDAVKVFATTGESCVVSGVHTARSLSPLTIDDCEDTKIGLLDTTKLNNNNEAIVTNDKVTVTQKDKEATDETKVFGVEDTPWRGVSTATSLSDLVGEMEKEELKDAGNEKDVVALQPTQQPPQPIAASPPPPPLPPKPKSKKVDPPSEPVYVDTSPVALPQNDSSVSAIAVAAIIEAKQPTPPPQRLPKSKSEVAKLNTKSIKMSTSYHENLKRENQLDPELAALIMKGKCRVKGNKSGAAAALPALNSKPLNGKLLPDEKKNVKQNRAPPAAAEAQMKKSGILTEGAASPKLKIQHKKVSQIQQSTTSMASEWNEDTLSLSVPSLSISAAFKMVESNSTADENKGQGQPSPPIGILETSNMILQSIVSSIADQGEVNGTGAGLGVNKMAPKGSAAESSNLFNQKPPAEFDLDGSMMSVASLKTEIASIEPLEEGMRELSIGGDTYTIGGGGAHDLTDAEDSFFDDTESIDAKVNSGSSHDEKGQTENNGVKGSPSLGSDPRFLTYTTKKHSSPRQKRRDDPGRYLTRTISPGSPKDSNGNHSSSSPTYFSTFRGERERSPRIVKPSTSATSNESSPNTSPKGIRGRRKPLYSSLPPQKRHGPGPPIPPKPTVGNGSAMLVRPTRASELRAASSRDSSPKNSSKNSSNSSLSNAGQAPPVVITSGAPPSNSSRKTPPKPPVRTSTSSSFRNFAVVRAVRNSNSSIGFSSGGDPGSGVESTYSTLPRSLKTSVSDEGQLKEGSKVGKLSTFWNQLMKGKGEGTGKHGEQKVNGNRGGGGDDKKSKFGFNFGRKKKQHGGSSATAATIATNWISAMDNATTVPVSTNNPDPESNNSNGNNKSTASNLNSQVKGGQQQAPSGVSSFTPSSKMTPV